MKFCQRCQRLSAGVTLTRLSNNIIYIYILSALSVLFLKIAFQGSFLGKIGGLVYSADSADKSLPPMKVNEKSVIVWALTKQMSAR
jgi:hypothetical protein